MNKGGELQIIPVANGYMVKKLPAANTTYSVGPEDTNVFKTTVGLASFIRDYYDQDDEDGDH